MESLSILHLTDLHMGNFRYENPATLAIKIAEILDGRGRKVDVIMVSRAGGTAAQVKTNR